MAEDSGTRASVPVTVVHVTHTNSLSEHLRDVRDVLVADLINSV